jgi:PAS domain S-box-containing protein
MIEWTIRNKTSAGFVTALLVLLAVIGGAYFTTESFLSSSRQISNSLRIISAQERVYSALVDLVWNQRAYVVSGSPDDLAVRQADATRLTNDQQALAALLETASGEQQARQLQLQTTINDAIALLDEGLAIRAGKPVTTERREALRANGRGLFDTIRNTLGMIESAERRDIESRMARNRRTAQMLYGALATVATLFLVGWGWLLRRIIADLKGRAIVETKSNETNAFLESLLENLPTMVFIKDAVDLRFMRFNRAGEQLLGYDRNQLIGKNDRDFFPPDQAEFFIDKDHEVLRNGTVTDIPEEEIDTRLQGRRILHTRKVPLLDKQGKPVALLGVSIDITDQKLAISEIVKLNTELQNKAEQLTMANKELEGFCYSVSHDLRAPLRAIDGYAGILELEHTSRLDAAGLRLLHGIRNNSQRMADLIDDLLEFSRVGRQTFEADKIDMTYVAIQAAAELTSGVKVVAPDATPKISIDPMLPIVGDARALHRVWMNLFDNAIKYSSHTKTPTIRAWSKQNGNETVYSVSDNGVGFDMQYHDKLFGVFERLHSTREYPGTGVGLAIVHRVVTRLGGRVWAESSPGQGAVFHFALPLQPEALNS